MACKDISFTVDPEIFEDRVFCICLMEILALIGTADRIFREED